MLRYLTTTLATAALLIFGASAAQAHYRDGARWSFGGYYTHQNDNDKLDPVNLIFYPYGIREYTSAGVTDEFDRADDHLREHRFPFSEYTNSNGLPGGVECKGDLFLPFPARGQKFPTQEQWVVWGSQAGVHDRCFTRYHARMWSDVNHLSDEPTPPGGSARRGHLNNLRDRWVLSPVHHERTNFVAGTGPLGLVPNVAKRGHYIDMPWDAVEMATIAKMRFRADSGHLDARGDLGGEGHCAKYHWRRLPGSRGYFGAQDPKNRPGARENGYYSDGWISRISMLHCRS